MFHVYHIIHMSAKLPCKWLNSMVFDRYNYRQPIAGWRLYNVNPGLINAIVYSLGATSPIVRLHLTLFMVPYGTPAIKQLFGVY